MFSFKQKAEIEDALDVKADPAAEIEESPSTTPKERKESTVEELKSTNMPKRTMPSPQNAPKSLPTKEMAKETTEEAEEGRISKQMDCERVCIFKYLPVLSA